MRKKHNMTNSLQHGKQNEKIHNMSIYFKKDRQSIDF